MIRVRDDVLPHCEPFELTDEYRITEGDQVTILQHAGGEQLGISYQKCRKDVGEYKYALYVLCIISTLVSALE